MKWREELERRYPEVLPNICVSGLSLAKRTDDLLVAGFGAILNVSEETYECTLPLVYRHVLLVDSEYCNATEFMRAVETLDELLRAGHRVVVHCACGISRSPAVVASHAVRYRRGDLRLQREKYRGLRLPEEYEFHHQYLADPVLACREGLSREVFDDPVFRCIVMAFETMAFVRPEVYVRPGLWQGLFPQIRHGLETYEGGSRGRA